MLKFATFAVISASLNGRERHRAGASFFKTASRAVFDYEPREGYLYVRSRAISSRCNDNFDAFPAEEIAKSYKTFIGKPVFVNHHNENHRRARGFIIDAALHHDTAPDGSPDTWVEVLMEVDAMRFPKLAEAVLNGDIDRTSMGTDVKYSVCSACGNKASSPADYCQHIPAMKGQRIYRTAASGRREGKLIFEECFGLSFFENSLLVEAPADPTAVAFVDRVGKGVHATRKTASAHPTDISEARPAMPNQFGRKVASSPMSRAADQDDAPQYSGKGPKTDTCGQCGGGIYLSPADDNWIHQDNAGAGVPHMGQPTSAKTSSMLGFADFLMQVEAAKKIPRKDMTPEQLAEDDRENARADTWLRRNPPRIKHVVSHWNLATDDERQNGMNWYQDAHHMTKAIAHDTGTPMHAMAGLMSNYSPQTHWAANIMNAAKVARTKVGMGGKGSGILATELQKDKADRMLGGEHYEDVLGGPKVKSFAHLIEHGGNADPEKPRVVVDRHAMSVACGSRASDRAYGRSGLGGKKKYAEYEQVYHKAAKQISKQVGYKVEAHQVQAATWLVRQRLNEEHDRALSKTAGSSSATRARGAIREWTRYAGEHHPSVLGMEPGTGYSPDAPDDVKHATEMKQEGQTHVALRQSTAYGEQKAPADVDTLRDAECPVCGGDSGIYDGNHCVECGYDAPPDFLRDPDLNLARQLDLRKDNLEESTGVDGVDTPTGQVLDPTQLDENGNPVDPAAQGGDPSALQDPNAPMDPNSVDENGLLQWGTPAGVRGEGESPDVDLAAGDRRFNQGGEPFTPGPNAPDPQQPLAPGAPVPPGQLDEDGNLIMPDGQRVDDQIPGGGQPGTPADGVTDLVCPACGFTADASMPTTITMDDKFAPQVDSGTMAGDVCPNCGKAPLTSVSDMAQMQQAQPAGVSA